MLPISSNIQSSQVQLPNSPLKSQSSLKRKLVSPSTPVTKSSNTIIEKRTISAPKKFHPKRRNHQAASPLSTTLYNIADLSSSSESEDTVVSYVSLDSSLRASSRNKTGLGTLETRSVNMSPSQIPQQRDTGTAFYEAMTAMVRKYQTLRQRVVEGTANQCLTQLQEEIQANPEELVLITAQIVADQLNDRRFNSEMSYLTFQQKDHQINMMHQTIGLREQEIQQLNIKIKELQSKLQILPDDSTILPSAWNKKATVRNATQSTKRLSLQHDTWNKETIALQPKGDQSPASLLKNVQDILGERAEELNVTARQTIKGIQVTCRSQDKVTEVKDTLLSMKDVVHVNAPRFAPLFKVAKLPIEMENEKILEQLKKYNSFFRDLQPNQVKLFNSLSHKKIGEKTVIFQTDGQTLKTILRNRGFKIGLSFYPVSEHIILIQCTRCLEYGHKKEDCPLCHVCLKQHEERHCQEEQVIRCMKCTGNHLAKDCKTRELQCSVCTNDKEVRRRRLLTNHRIGALSCHVRKRMEDKKREATLYGNEPYKAKKNSNDIDQFRDAEMSETISGKA